MRIIFDLEDDLGLELQLRYVRDFLAEGFTTCVYLYDSNGDDERAYYISYTRSGKSIRVQGAKRS